MSRLPLPALALCLSMACVRAAPVPAPTSPAPPSPPAFRIPAGCEENLSGLYVHAENPAYQYRGVDDGRTLRLEVQRVVPNGGGGTSDPGPGAQWVELTRSPEGFAGATHASAFTPAGRACAVEFPTEVTACSAEGLTLLTAASTAIDESCAQPERPAAPQRVEQRLRRAE